MSAASETSKLRSEARVRTLLVAAFVFAATLALALPGLLASWPLLPDAIEYLGIAHSWVSGAGFVDPVLYSYFLPNTTPPVLALLGAVLAGYGAIDPRRPQCSRWRSGCSAPNLACVATLRGHALFEVKDPSPRTRPWVALPPLSELCPEASVASRSAGQSRSKAYTVVWA